ncbi:hypothetical protein V6N13_146793 [Hibiscus sabdariffa]
MVTKLILNIPPTSTTTLHHHCCNQPSITVLTASHLRCQTMRRLFASNILISRMQGLGVEIARNLILVGVKSVTLHDEGAVELWDLSTNFVFSERD